MLHLTQDLIAQLQSKAAQLKAIQKPTRLIKSEYHVGWLYVT